MHTKSVAALAAAATLSLAAPAGATPAWTPPEASWIRNYAIEQGHAVDIDDELVPMTLDLYDLSRLKQCETGSMGWHERGSNPRFVGPFQWHPPTAAAYGLPGDEAWTASIERQLQAVRDNVAAHGETFSQFPGCRRRLGLA